MKKTLKSFLVLSALSFSLNATAGFAWICWEEYMCKVVPERGLVCGMWTICERVNTPSLP